MHQTDTKPENKDILRRSMKSTKTYILVTWISRALWKHELNISSIHSNC